MSKTEKHTDTQMAIPLWPAADNGTTCPTHMTKQDQLRTLAQIPTQKMKPVVDANSERRFYIYVFTFKRQLIRIKNTPSVYYSC